MVFTNEIERLKNDILGRQYSLSIAYVSEKKSQEINKEYRGKNKPTNILSFALRKNEGELVLCPSVIKREVKEKNKSPHQRSAGETETFKEWLNFIIIHGMLHLKGLEHGPKMEKLEKKYLSSSKF